MALESKRPAPVVAFAYNRPDKIIRCLEALDKCNEALESELFIYCDGPKSDAGKASVLETRRAVLEYKESSHFAKVSVIEAPENKGLAASIIGGVTEVVERYGRVIVVEDDLVVSDRFLSFMNGALDFYEDQKAIGAISGYTYPIKALKGYQSDVYAMHKGDCWGWGTWKDRWDKASWAEVDYDRYFADKALRRRFENTENLWDMAMIRQSQGKINSWAIRWCLYLFNNGLLTVYPRYSLVTNAGFDGSGTHSNKAEERLYYSDNSLGDGEIQFKVLTPDRTLEKEAASFPRKGISAGVRYCLKRLYTLGFDISRLIKGKKR